jgi:hypothetical protein
MHFNHIDLLGYNNMIVAEYTRTWILKQQIVLPQKVMS